MKSSNLRRAILAVVALPLLTLAPMRPVPALRSAAAQEKAPQARTDDVARNDALARRRLEQRIPLELIETPLEDALAFLGDSLGLEIYVAWKEVEKAGIDADAPITITLDRVRGAMALDLILGQAGAGNLTYVIRDGVAIISTADNLDGAATVRVYNCRDLLAKHAAAEAMYPGGMAPGGGYSTYPPPGGFGGSPGSPSAPPPPPPVTSPGAERLVSLLTRSVAPSSWQSRGGSGVIAEYDGLVIVNHNARAHEQIERVLKMLREAAATGDKPSVIGGEAKRRSGVE
jgi:general secretion pathway protein D